MELLQDLVDLFDKEAPVLLAKISAAVEQGALEDLQKASHKLKGSLLQFSARPAAALASGLEQMGKSGSLDGAAEKAAELKSEVLALGEALRKMVHGGSSVI